MNQDRDGFLARWSRRKLEVRQEPAPEQAPGPDDEHTIAAGSSEPELTPEEIAALPRIEDLTADADISAFLRKGVPEILKKAALRRMWVLDPAIRDYVSEAREYAYDWNVPGGVPGNGPLLPTDDVAAMVEQVFGRRSVEAGAPSAAPVQGYSQTSEPEQTTPSVPNDATMPDAAMHQNEGESKLAEALETPGTRGEDGQPADALEQMSLAAPHSAAREPQPPGNARRHGGAKPV